MSGLTATRKAALTAQVWRAGNRARIACWRSQQPLYDGIRASWGQGVYSALCHRNAGKSTVLIGVADEECRRAPNTPCAIITDTKDHAQKIVDEKMSEYLATCPQKDRPEPTDSKYMWRYPNGSTLWLYGADDHRHVKTLRGLALRFVGIDEAGHVEGSSGIGLARILRSILFPALAKRLKAHPDKPGHVVLATTAPLTPGHDFWSLWHECEAYGRAFFLPLSANTDFTPVYRAARAAECGGEETLDYQREYECAEVSDPDTTVLPNVIEARIKGTDGKPALVQPVRAPGPREWYRSMDIGGKHLTGVLWGYYEPETDTVCIAREWASRNTTGPEVAKGIMQSELALWPDGQPERLEGWSDNNQLGFLYELDTGYKIRFYPTRKDDKIAQLSALRKMIGDGKIILDPSCTLTLSTFRKAQWAQGLTSRGFAETAEIGHADLLDAALYLVRNVRRRPYPVIPITLEQQAVAPDARPALRTPGMRKLAAVLGGEAA